MKISLSRFIACAVLYAGSSFGTFAYNTPTMGWSSWNAYGHRISEQIIKSQADALADKGLRDAGYVYLNIDDGAFCGRDENGHLRIHPTRFPNGMKTVVDYIHSKGLKAGTYSDAGMSTCASFWGGDKDGVGTGLYGHDTDDINFLFKELGFEFIKVDFCGGDPNQNPEHLELSEQERYTAIGRAIRDTQLEGVRFNVCRWAYPGTWVQDVASSWRMSQDIYLGWASVADIIHQNLYLSAYASEGRFNDMDMLEVGRGLSECEDITHFAMWCVMSSPLLLGCDLASINDKALSLVTNPELVAVNQDPLALQAYVVDQTDGAYVLVKDFAELHGTKRVVALYNPSDRKVLMELDFHSLELGGNVKMRDLIGRTDLEPASGYYRETVPPHSTRVYLLEAETRLPRYVYEAETGWISAYQELVNNQSAQSGIYTEGDGLSGGAKASWLGMRPDNDLQWRNVWVADGGDYTMSVTFISGADRNVNIFVNGEDAGSFIGNSGSWTQPATVDIPVTLRAGNNVVRLWNDGDWMPDIDCMTIVGNGDLGLYKHEFEKAVRDALAFDTAALPSAMRNCIADVLASYPVSMNTRGEYEEATTAIRGVLASASEAVAEYAAFGLLRESATANLDATLPGSGADALAEAISLADTNVAVALSAADIALAGNDLRVAMRCHLTSSDTRLAPDCEWDATVMLENPHFNSDTNGWSGGAVWGHGCAEHWNKSFDTGQTVAQLKPGRYRVDVQALYRVAANDGGARYRAGIESIPALVVANDESVAVASLYSVPVSGHDELEALSGTHVLRGYVNSMFGASEAFRLGLYENSIECKVEEDSALSIGLKCPTFTGDCWVCFDNFRLHYLGNESDGIGDLTVDPNCQPEYFTLQGIRITSPTPGTLVIRRYCSQTDKIIFTR